MTDDIRQKVRDYAREYATIDIYRRDTTWEEYRDYPAGQRGEMAGKTFVALQNVLDAIGDGGPVDATTWPHGRIILAAIAKAFA